MKPYDYIVVGAGVVGLSTAYKLQERNSSARILVLDKEPYEAFHQTGRNSGVIHSGLYYKPGSYKAKLCVDGYDQLLRFSEAHGVPYKICGKLVVANGEQEEIRLEKLFRRGQANGLSGLKFLGAEEVKGHEPYVRASKAVWVPQTGVIDYKFLCAKLVSLLRSSGAEVRFNTKIVSVSKGRHGVEVLSEGHQFIGKQLINCAGVFSDRLAEMDETKKSLQEPVKIIPFRGEYYDLTEQASEKVKGLIYPVPDPAFPFLGVHLTRGVDGHVEAGPNAVLAMAREGYTWSDLNVDELFESLTWPGFIKIAAKYWDKGLTEVWRSLSKAAFLRSLQELMPSLTEDDIVPGGAGIRAQACGKYSELLDDFCISKSELGLHVINAPSPAATSCFAIADHICNQL